jgi:hypothetical protein
MRLGVGVFRRSAGLPRNIRLALRLSSAGACLLLALLFAQVAHATVVGDQGPTYSVSGSATQTIKNPTLTGPESKLWYKDGRWWGVLWDTTSGSHHIFWLNQSTPDHEWVDTGVLVDGRNTVRVDALSAGPKLWVATHVYGVDGGGGKARLFRYSYHSASQTYTRDRRFPVRINSAISKTLVITKEIGHNVLWASWVEPVVPGRREVLIAKGLKGGKKWEAPFRVPGSRTVGYDDISSIVAFGTKVGVLWSDSNNGDGNRFRFATHRDRARSSNWSLERPYLTGRRMVDDHISLKSWDGRVYAAVKDASRGINVDGPILILLVREPNGHWHNAGIASNGNQLTRPVLLIDPGANELHVFANGPNFRPGTIFEKTSPLDVPSFDVRGLPTPFISDDQKPGLEVATSTKQPVSPSLGLVVVAANFMNHTYYYREE